MLDEIKEPGGGDEWQLILAIHEGAQEECQKLIDDPQYRKECGWPGDISKKQLAFDLTQNILQFYCAIFVEQYPEYRERILELDWTISTENKTG